MAVVSGGTHDGWHTSVKEAFDSVHRFVKRHPIYGGAKEHKLSRGHECLRASREKREGDNSDTMKHPSLAHESIRHVVVSLEEFPHQGKEEGSTKA
jgi:hypothetical protein